MFILRPYQERSLNALREGFRSGHDNQILYMPTGSGKTECSISLLLATAKAGNRAAMVMDRRILVDQTSQRLDKYNIDHGVLMAGHWRYRTDKHIQICSAQTLEARGSFPGLKLLIVDEAHTVRKSVSDFIKSSGIKTIGLTASPFTKGLGSIYSNVISEITTAELVGEGSLVPLRVFISKEIDMTDARKVAGEWSQSEATERGIKITGDIVAEWVKKTNQIFGKPEKTIVFCAGVAHGADLQEKFSQAGYNFVSISYKDDDEFKKDAIKEFEKPDSSIHGLIATDILTKGFDCFDSKTEILTPAGWKGIGEFSVGDSVYGFNKETGRVEIVEVEGYGDRLLRENERMVSIKSQRFDIRTTEGHQFHIKYRDPNLGGARSSNYITKTALEMVERKSSYVLPISAECDFPGVPLSDDELRLIAWFMTDGGFSGRTFQICQSKEYKHEIRNLLVRIGVDFNEYQSDCSGYPNGKTATKFDIPKGTHSGTLARNGWHKYSEYLDKNVSPSLMNMTREQFRVFWDELIKGDGAKQANKCGWLWCDRKEQADAYTHMAVVRGFSASYSIQKTKKGKSMYVISVRDSQWISTDPSSKLAAHFVIDQSDENEKVWCIKNRLSTVITRRGGKIAIVGNCPDVKIGISARPFTKSLSSHVQQMGRVMRPCFGKEFALWLDHSGNYLRFKEDWEELYCHGVSILDDGKEKPKKEPTKAEKESAKCPKCSHLWPHRTDICPCCGYVKQKNNDVIVKSGELVELGDTLKKEADYRRSFFHQLLTYQDSKPHYKPSWARVKYREKFGEWPRFAEGREPLTGGVSDWIKSRFIKFANRKSK